MDYNTGYRDIDYFCGVKIIVNRCYKPQGCAFTR